MSRTAITTDSGVAIELAGVSTIPLAVVDDETGQSFLDQREISIREVYRLRDEGHRIITSCMTPYDMETFFERQLETHDQILHLSMSDKISAGSYECSAMVAAKLDAQRIRVVNSKQGGAGGAQLALRALLAAEREDNLDRLAAQLEQELVPRIATSFIVPDPSGYRRSGKGMVNTFINMGISALTSGGGFPLIKINNSGKLMPYSKLKPGGENMYLAFAKAFLDERHMADKTISIATLDPDEAALIPLREWLEQQDYEVSYSTMSAVIASYACKDTLGISYLQKA